MRYAIARYNQHQRDLAYRIYVTDCLRITTENTAKAVSVLSHGQCDVGYIKIRYCDANKDVPVDNRTADEIINDIRNKLK